MSCNFFLNAFWTLSLKPENQPENSGVVEILVQINHPSVLVRFRLHNEIDSIFPSPLLQEFYTVQNTCLNRNDFNKYITIAPSKLFMLFTVFWFVESYLFVLSKTTRCQSSPSRILTSAFLFAKLTRFNVVLKSRGKKGLHVSLGWNVSFVFLRLFLLCIHLIRLFLKV